MSDRDKKRKQAKFGIRDGGGIRWNGLEMRVLFRRGKRATVILDGVEGELVIPLKPKKIDDSAQTN